MAEGNGSKRPFGPHGEGCECEPEGGPEAERTETAPESHRGRPERGPKRVTITQDPNSLHEIVWATASESFTQHILGAITTCAMDGEPLTETQMSHILAGATRGFALAKEGAQIIETNYMRLIVETQEAAAEEKRGELHDVNDLFRRRENGGDQS